LTNFSINKQQFPLAFQTPNKINLASLENIQGKNNTLSDKEQKGHFYIS